MLIKRPTNLFHLLLYSLYICTQFDSGKEQYIPVCFILNSSWFRWALTNNIISLIRTSKFKKIIKLIQRKQFVQALAGCCSFMKDKFLKKAWVKYSLLSWRLYQTRLSIFWKWLNWNFFSYKTMDISANKTYNIHYCLLKISTSISISGKW
jgi:hypothetical protein